MIIVSPEYVTQTVAPTAEPVSRTEAKLHLRVDVTTDDSLIDNLIQAAREYVELYTGRSLVLRTYRADLPYFSDEIQLPFKPIIAISHIKYYTAASPSILTTLAATNYELARDMVYRSNGGTYPAADSVYNAVQITYTAGYASTSSPYDAASDVPEAIKSAIKLTIGDLYENREAQVLYPGSMQSNKTTERLLDSYRVYK